MRRSSKAVGTLAAATSLMLVGSGLAFADLKLDADLTANGIQKVENVGQALVGGDTYPVTVALWYTSNSVTSLTFAVDQKPAFVTTVGGDTINGSGDNNKKTSTVNVVAPCTIGTFGSNSSSSASAGNSVTYKVTNFTRSSGTDAPGVTDAWVNVHGSVTSLGSNCTSSPADTTNPTSQATATVPGTSGPVAHATDTWTNKNVTVALSGSDNTGGSGLKEIRYTTDGTAPTKTTGTVYDGTALTYSTTGVTTIKHIAVDNAGNVGDVGTFVVKVDKVLPVISSSATVPSGTTSVAYMAGTWTKETVTVAFSCSDTGGSGIASDTATGSSEKAASGEDQSASSSGSCTDVAGNSAVQATFSDIDIDKAAPNITVTTPAGLDAQGKAPVYTLGQQVFADYACDDLFGAAPGTPLSGVSTCAGNVASGAAIDTSTVGGKMFTVNATDNAGNQADPIIRNYSVQYAFGGWQQPVVSLPTRNVVKAGRGVPVKFTLGGDQGMDIFAPVSPGSTAKAPTSANTTCGTTTTDPVEETVTAGSSSLQYDASTGTYTYVWKTDSAWAGKCRTFNLNLKDGSTHSISFQFTK